MSNKIEQREEISESINFNLLPSRKHFGKLTIFSLRNHVEEISCNPKKEVEQLLKTWSPVQAATHTQNFLECSDNDFPLTLTNRRFLLQI